MMKDITTKRPKKNKVEKKKKKKKRKKEKKHSNRIEKSKEESSNNDTSTPYEMKVSQQEQDEKGTISLSSNITRANEGKMGLQVSLLLSKSENNKSCYDDVKMIPEPFPTNCLCSFDRIDKNVTTHLKNKMIQISILELARNVFTNILHKRKRKHNNNRQNKNILSSVSPTPIQLQTWSILNHDQEKQIEINNDCSVSSVKNNKIPNIIAIAPTGSGKTLCYGIPLIQSAIAKIMQQPSFASNHDTPGDHIHGIVLVPTRELAIQVSKELKIVAKVANRMLSSNIHLKNDSNAQRPVIQVLAIYGGVSKEEQYQSLLGKGDQNPVNSEKSRTIIIAATPGRFIDLMTSSSPSLLSDKTHKSSKSEENDHIDHGDDSFKADAKSYIDSSLQFLFRQLYSVTVDEADRMATNKDVCKQVDCILHLIKDVPSSLNLTESNSNRNDIHSISLYSATYPQSVIDKFIEWMLPNRLSIIIKVNTMTLLNDDNVKEKTKANTDGTKSIQNESDTDTKDEKQAIVVPDKSKNILPTSADKGDEQLHLNSPDSNTKNKRKRGEPMELASIPSHVTQILHVCATHKKPKKLLTTISKIRKDENNGPQGTGRRRQQGLIIIFFATIKSLNFISKMLYKEGIRCVEINSHLNQQRRERALNDFRCGKIPILLATDIAARGIHVNNIEYVINYDFPSSLEQYVHRCGRTGRSQISSSNITLDNQDDSKGKQNRSAIVYSFFHRELAPMANDVINLLHQCKAWIDPNLRELLSSSKKKKRSNTNKKSDSAQTKSSNTHFLNKEACTQNTIGSESHSDEEYDDEFSALGGLRIVLKRASHVSDAEDSSDDEIVSKED